MFDFGFFKGGIGLDGGQETIKMVALFVAVLQFIVLLAGLEGFVFSLAIWIYLTFIFVFCILFSLLGGLAGAFFKVSGAGWFWVAGLALVFAHILAERQIDQFWKDWKITIIALVFTFVGLPLHLWGYFFAYNPNGFGDYFLGSSAVYAWGVTLGSILLGFVVLKSIKWVYPYIALISRSFVFSVACVITLHPKIIGRLWDVSLHGGGGLEDYIYRYLDTLLGIGTTHVETMVLFFFGGLALALFASWINRFRESSFYFFQSLESVDGDFLDASIVSYLGWGIGACFSTLMNMFILRRPLVCKRPLFARITLLGNGDCIPRHEDVEEGI